MKKGKNFNSKQRKIVTAKVKLYLKNFILYLGNVISREYMGNTLNFREPKVYTLCKSTFTLVSFQNISPKKVPYHLKNAKRN